MIVRLSGCSGPELFHIFLRIGNLLMISVGEILRGARESQGRTMAEIAEELCITQRYLRALERDDLSNLPGAFFYKSFVRQYAAILGVPVTQLQPGLDAITANEAEPPLPGQLPLSLATAESGGRSSRAVRVLDPLVEASNHYFSNRKIGVPMAALAAVLLACSGFYSWWNQPPKQARAARSQPAVAARPAAGSSLAAAQAPIVDVSTTADGVNHVVLNLSATESTWLSITSEGKQIFSGILQPSQTKTLTAPDAAQMRVGNAGGIAVRLNGKEIGPLGERGQVRTILFTPDKFEIVEPPPPAPPDDATL
jgi:transcriptional regulator with XRE-family HTH domain